MLESSPVSHNAFTADPIMAQRSNIGFQNNSEFLKEFVSQHNDQYQEYNVEPQRDSFNINQQNNLKSIQETLPQISQKRKNNFGQIKKDRNKKNLKNLVFDNEDLPDILHKIKDLESLSNFFFLDLKRKLKSEVVNTSTNLKVYILNKLERYPKIQVTLMDNFEDSSKYDPGKVN
jgi:hypothetical protein